MNTAEEGQQPLSDRLELYFTITKFENDIGFSLIHQEQEIDDEGYNTNEDIKENPNLGTID